MILSILLSLFLSIGAPTTPKSNVVDSDTVSVVTGAEKMEKVVKGLEAITTTVVDSIRKDMSPAGIFRKITQAKDETIDQIVTNGVHALLVYGMRILLAIVLFMVARFLITRYVAFFRMLFKRRGMEASFVVFLSNLINVVSYVALIITLVNVIGFESTSFLALLASAGVGIGMAMSGTLQNFAGGVLILFTRPYVLGDMIEAMNYRGFVKEIRLFHTVILTADNQVIMIPNGSLSSGIINNFTKEKSRRGEWRFSIAYGDDFDVAKELIKKILDEDTRVLKDPEYIIVIDAFADSSVTILVRAWTLVDDHWAVKWDVNERFYKIYQQHGLSIPFPQMDVYVKKV